MRFTYKYRKRIIFFLVKDNGIITMLDPSIFDYLICLLSDCKKKKKEQQYKILA